MTALYWKCNGHRVFIDNLMGGFGIIEQQNVLVCNSQTAYAFCFMNGLTEKAIEDAGNIARRIIKDKIKQKLNQWH